MQQRMTKAGVRLDHGQAARVNVSAQSAGGFARLMPQRSLIAVAQDAQRDHPGPTTIGNPENVGLARGGGTSPLLGTLAILPPTGVHEPPIWEMSPMIRVTVIRRDAMCRFHGTKVIIGLCALLVGLTATSAWADGSPFMGRWHWNRAQSTLLPGDPVPADITADISRVDRTHIKYSTTVTDAQGNRRIDHFDTPANGEFYPISSDTTASFQLIGNTLQATFKGPADKSNSLTCSLSTDQRKMTCNGIMSREGGKTATYVDVYDRS